MDLGTPILRRCHHPFTGDNYRRRFTPSPETLHLRNRSRRRRFLLVAINPLQNTLLRRLPLPLVFSICRIRWILTRLQIMWLLPLKLM
ncbi:hypothetical protein L1987_23657 [Smallanthus sonchifolius]|uniref:Uncharacterized protein n=1 Tax=Smallanthus sonchifolius TaxID=185202 RepID=A0ACB9IJL1_9ASTR|nr:hypothetical protein L1987_23657 [Smallanthus sonchifolius]